MKNCIIRVGLVFFYVIFSAHVHANDLTKKTRELRDKINVENAYTDEEYLEMYKNARQLLDRAKKSKDYDNIVHLNTVIADIFVSKLSQPRSAERYLYEASNYVLRCEDQKVVMYFRYVLAEQSFNISEYKRAKKTLKELMAFVDPGDKGYKQDMSAFNHAIATICIKQSQPDSAIYYFEKAIEIAKSMPNYTLDWSADSEIFMIQTKVDQGDTDIALLERIEELILHLKNTNTPVRLVQTYCLKARYFIAAKSYTEALHTLDSARLAMEDMNMVNLVTETYWLSAKAYEGLDDYKNSQRYYKQYVSRKDSLNDIDRESQLSVSALIIKNIEVENKMYRAKVRNQEIESERQSLLYLLATAIVSLILISVILLVIRSKNRKYRKLSEINLDLKNKEIKYKEEQLGAFATDIVRRSTFLKELQTDLKKIRSQPSDEKVKEAVNELSLRVNNQSYVNSQLLEIQRKVEDINNNYYLKLEELCPDLSNADKQLCSLIKLGLSQSELAIIFGIETVSLKKKKYRLKKKLGLSPDDDLDSYLLSIA